MIPASTPAGVLPPGRHPSTIPEFTNRYVTTPHRAACQAQLISMITDFISTVGPLAYLWIGGSFLDDTREPDDLDVVILAEHAVLDRAWRAYGPGRRYLENIADGDTDQLFPLLDLHLLAVYPPLITGMSDSSLNQRKYLAHRGYWDELWSARRTTSGAPHRNEHGYLEVIIDGYA